MITFKQKGSFKKTETFLRNGQRLNVIAILRRYGDIGVSALSAATPSDSGLTANSWDYQIERSQWGWQITWTNTHENKGANIAILIQYGHGTGTGGYVPPNDYINPAMKPVFDKMADDIWKEVSSL
jgi:hypothetical protein